MTKIDLFIGIFLASLILSASLGSAHNIQKTSSKEDEAFNKGVLLCAEMKELTRTANLAAYLDRNS